jgi:hypothetical protein
MCRDALPNQERYFARIGRRKLQESAERIAGNDRGRRAGFMLY